MKRFYQLDDGQLVPYSLREDKDLFACPHNRIQPAGKTIVIRVQSNEDPEERVKYWVDNSMAIKKC